MLGERWWDILIRLSEEQTMTTCGRGVVAVVVFVSLQFSPFPYSQVPWFYSLSMVYISLQLHTCPQLLQARHTLLRLSTQLLYKDTRIILYTYWLNISTNIYLIHNKIHLFVIQIGDSPHSDDLCLWQAVIPWYSTKRFVLFEMSPKEL